MPLSPRRSVVWFGLAFCAFRLAFSVGPRGPPASSARIHGSPCVGLSTAMSPHPHPEATPQEEEREEEEEEHSGSSWWRQQR